MRSALSLADLWTRRKDADKLMTVKMPLRLSDAIDRVARELGATKAEVVTALFNEGLDVAAQSLRGWKPKKTELPPPKPVCSVRGCQRVHLAKGY